MKRQASFRMGRRKSFCPHTQGQGRGVIRQGLGTFSVGTTDGGKVLLASSG